MYWSGAPADLVGDLHLPERTFTVMGKFLSWPDAMPTLPSWELPNSELWAPDVRKVGATYVMWFSGLDRGHTLSTGVAAQCIGVATSTSPTGPFTADSPDLTDCQASGHGDIDPRTFVAPDGQEWLYWKNDGNAVPTMDLVGNIHIYAQRLATDGQTLVGSPSVLLTNDLPWEGGLIEAPDMVHVGNRHLLFFAGNSSNGVANGIGLALCKEPGGPCSSPYSGPRFGSNLQGAGPGEETVYNQNGITWMLYTPHGVYYPLALPEARRRAHSLHADGDALHRRPPGNGAWCDGWKGRASRLALTRAARGAACSSVQDRSGGIRSMPARTPF